MKNDQQDPTRKKIGFLTAIVGILLPLSILLNTSVGDFTVLGVSKDFIAGFFTGVLLGASCVLLIKVGGYQQR